MEVVFLVLMILLSAFFSGLEIALFSLGKAHLRTLIDQGVPGAATVHKLKKRPERLLVVILIGNNIVNIGAASLATAVAIRLFGEIGISLATGLMTLLILIFGEITPKTFAVKYSEKIALKCAPFLVAFSWLVYPAAWLLEKMSIALTKAASKAKREEMEHETLLTSLSKMGLEEGKIEAHEHQLVENAFRMDKTKAERIMTPRGYIVSVKSGTTLQEAENILREKPFSRFPIIGDEKEGVTGILNIRDLYTGIMQGKENTTVDSIAVKPIFIPATMPASDLLLLFQHRRLHLAVVLDEYGDTDGIVTLEDVLEELVGEIEDEADISRASIIKMLNGHVLVYTSVTIDDLNRALEIELPTEGANTLNGLLLNHFQRIPDTNESTTIGDFKIVIRQTDSRKTILAELIRQEQ